MWEEWNIILNFNRKDKTQLHTILYKDLFSAKLGEQIIKYVKNF